MTRGRELDKLVSELNKFDTLYYMSDVCSKVLEGQLKEDELREKLAELNGAETNYVEQRLDINAKGFFIDGLYPKIEFI